LAIKIIANAKFSLTSYQSSVCFCKVRTWTRKPTLRTT